MLVCMVMQIASVFPHHHHSELFCLHADLATCAGEDCNTAGMHHEGDGDRHTCTVGCVTHFQCATTGHHQDTVAPDYTFYSFAFRRDVHREPAHAGCSLQYGLACSPCLLILL